MLCFSCVCCITQNLSLCKSLKSPKQAKRASSLEDFFFSFFPPWNSPGGCALLPPRGLSDGHREWQAAASVPPRTFVFVVLQYCTAGLRRAVTKLHTRSVENIISLSRDGIEKLPLLFLSMAYHGSGEPWSPESGKEHRLERFLQEPRPRIVQRPRTPECGPSKVVSKDGSRKPSKGQAGERGPRLAPPSEAEPPWTSPFVSPKASLSSLMTLRGDILPWDLSLLAMKEQQKIYGLYGTRDSEMGTGAIHSREILVPSRQFFKSWSRTIKWSLNGFSKLKLPEHTVGGGSF